MFKGLGNLANLGQMMQQAQQMGTKMKEMEESLKTKRATGSAGGGMVEVDVNGAGDALAVRIDPVLIEKQDREMIEDLLPAAINDAIAKTKELRAEAMKDITGDMNLPGLDDMMSKFGGGAD